MDNLYPHQIEAFNLLMAGKNVILQAPTGSGKTVAALNPFFEAFDNPHYDFPQRCIYSVPMRILANQFHYEANKWVGSLNRQYKTDLNVAIQTGNNAQSPDLTHNLIFATIDQTLSSFLMSPYGLSARKGNLNAGALLSSYLVFDEFHLYDLNTTFPTTLYMLKQLKGIAPFMLMTATFSPTMLHDLAQELDAVVVPQDDSAMQAILKIPSQDKKRRYHTSDEVMSAEAILHHHLQLHIRHSIVICNQVDRARHLHRDLNELAPDEVEVILLHSRFLPDDRKIAEESIRNLFAKGREDGSYIVVSTQAIEVGVDITSTALHTELAPANAIIQRAGRCARYKDDIGDVYIYRYVTNPNPKPEDETDQLDLLDKVLPYKNQEVVFQKTWHAFYKSSGQIFTYQDELDIVSHAHSEADQQTLAQLRAGQFAYQQQIYAVQDNGKKADAKHLIRDIFQQNIIIHNDPPDTFGRELIQIESISLHPGTLQGYISNWLEQSYLLDDIDWVVKYAYEIDDEDMMQANDEVRYRVKAIQQNATEAFGAPLVIVHPDFATYTATEGFIPNRGGNYTMTLSDDTKSDKSSASYDGKGYRKETYETHIRLVHQAFEEQWQDVAWGAQQMERKYDWDAGTIRRATELAVLLHDVGKLSIGWQTWAHNYQQKLFVELDSSDHEPNPTEAYAHTDQDFSEEKKEIERSIKPRRPWHAVEGALAVIPILITEFKAYPELIGAIYSAIARHHAPNSASNMACRLVDNAETHIHATLNVQGFDSVQVQLIKNMREDEDRQKKNVVTLGIDPNEAVMRAFLLYCLIVRALRRADGKGTERGKNE